MIIHTKVHFEGAGEKVASEKNFVTAYHPKLLINKQFDGFSEKIQLSKRLLLERSASVLQKRSALGPGVDRRAILEKKSSKARRKLSE
jgi:hypothetical protein